MTTTLTAAQRRGLAHLATDPTMRLAGRPAPGTRRALVAAGLVVSDGQGGYTMTSDGLAVLNS